MVFTGATGLDSFEEEIENTSNYILSVFDSVLASANGFTSLEEQNTSNYIERVDIKLDSLRDEVGYEVGYNPDPTYIAVPTGLYARIEVQETLVGNPKVGLVPSSGLFERIGEQGSIIDEIPIPGTGVYLYIDEAVEVLEGEVEGIETQVEGIETQIEGIEGQIVTLEEQVTALEAANVIDTVDDGLGWLSSFFSWGEGEAKTVAIGALVTTIGITAGTAKSTADTADGKADTALSLWDKGTDDYVDNIYQIASGNIGIGTLFPKNTALTNKL